MKWILTAKELPKKDQEVIIHLHGDYHNCYRAKFDLSYPYIAQTDKLKFWRRSEKGNFEKPLAPIEVLYWIPFPKYDWEDK